MLPGLEVRTAEGERIRLVAEGEAKKERVADLLRLVGLIQSVPRCLKAPDTPAAPPGNVVCSSSWSTGVAILLARYWR